MPGDVVLYGRNRIPRVVRGITIGTSWGNTCFDFAIKRCSWTGRCYTVQNLNDIMYAGGIWPTRKRVSLRKAIDKKIAHCLTYENRDPKDQIIDCCDVEGVP